MEWFSMGRNKLLVSIAIAFGIVIFWPSLVSAETTEGIQVQPIRSYPTLDAGTTLKATLKLKNTTSQPQNISMNVENFLVQNADYDYAFRDSEETKWITFEESSFELQPSEIKIVNYTIAIPGNASPGGHYFSLLTTVDPKEDEQGVTEIRRVASLVYLEVGGDVVKNVSLKSFEAPWLTFDRTVPADVYLANSGNTHVRARVLMQGRSFLEQVSLQSPKEYALIEGTTLPSTLRKLHSEIKLPNRPGLFRVAAEYAPPQGGNPTIIQRTIIYSPLWFIAVLAMLLTGLVICFVRFAKSHRLQKNKTQP